MERPSPATVARAYERQTHAPIPGQLLADLRASFPDIVDEAARYGVDLRESVDAWEQGMDPGQAHALVSPDSSRFQKAASIGVIADRRGLPLIAYLAAEAALSRRSASLAGYLRSSGTSLEAVLRLLADRLGEAFLDAAFRVTWHRRAVFARLLEGARAYLEWARQAELLSGVSPRRGVQTRLGIAAVLTARFGPITELELREARAMLLESHRQGAERALEYFVEASIWLFDLFEERGALLEAARELRANANSEASTSTIAAHLWLRLAGTGSRPNGVAGFLELSQEAISGRRRWITNRYEDASLVLLEATIDQIRDDLNKGEVDLSTRGILLPFGHRRPDTPTASLFGRALPRLISSLRASEFSGDFVFRDLTATFLSLYARLPSTSRDDAIDALSAAVSTRSGNTKDRARPLNRIGVEIDQAADRFLLAHLTNSPDVRRLGFVDLVRAAGPDDMRPRYLTMIAKEVEEHGQLSGGFVPGPDEVALAIRAGDSASLFEAAARAAYKSADLTQVLLGGRGGVVTLRDSDGISGQTFVYKRTRVEAKARDEGYSNAVMEELKKRGLVDRYGLIEHLTDIANVDAPSEESAPIISVRRFSDGVPLLDHLRVQEPANAGSTLQEVADFLALIHHAGRDIADVNGTRASLKQTELGRWLRKLQFSDEERSALFDQWWNIVATAPVLPRRDAHPLNWLIGTDDRIRAVDLESQGARPFGYELAQLIEDGQVLPPSEYDARTPILESYTSAWEVLAETSLDRSEVRAWYDAGALARGVRALSEPNANAQQLAYGGDLISALSSQAEDDAVRKMALVVARRWNQMTGRIGEGGTKVLSDADRRRISRAMSFHLRHDASAPATKTGWVHVDDLVDTLRARGHKVSSAQLLLIAGALGEPRFELDHEDIRAAYGHSVAAQIDYEVRRPPLILFHATPTRNLASVFEARAGLRPGARKWVHLTESCDVAVNAARRQQAPVSVLEIDAPNVAGLVHAAGATWLAPVVAIDAMRILPVRGVRELTQDLQAGAI